MSTLFQPGVAILPLQNGRILEFDNGGAQGGAIPVNVGTFIANGATAVVVANANVTASSQVLITLKTVGGTPAADPYISSITTGIGFSVIAAAGDSSVYNYAVIG